jgi:AcrR family transcriptional regulator
MARRNEHSLEEIREMVLDAAETIIVNEGFAALTVRKIAMEIGYTVASIYMVFANMADLTMHIKANTVDELNEQLQQVPDCEPEQFITELARRYLIFAGRNFNRWQIAFAQNAEIPEWYRLKIQLLFGPLETQLAKLAPNCPEQQRKMAAQALWSGIHGICILSLNGKMNTADINKAENAISLLVDSFIRGWILNQNA